MLHSVHSRPNLLISLLALTTVLLSSLACSIDLGSGNSAEELGLQQTAVALQQTQTALENATLPQDQTTGEPAPQVEVPGEQPDVVYEGISFSFDPNITQSVNMSTVPSQNMGEDYMPAKPTPPTLSLHSIIMQSLTISTPQRSSSIPLMNIVRSALTHRKE